MKAGSFDKYLMNTSVKDIDSKFGLYVRDLMLKKQKDPTMEVGYIPGNCKMSRTRKTNIWEYK